VPHPRAPPLAGEGGSIEKAPQAPPSLAFDR
jgi:hypothetical protein